MPNYRCPMCRKICSEHLDLARHYLGQTDKKHKEWLKTQGLSYAELIKAQITEFGNKGLWRCQLSQIDAFMFGSTA